MELKQFFLMLTIIILRNSYYITALQSMLLFNCKEYNINVLVCTTIMQLITNNFYESM